MKFYYGMYRGALDRIHNNIREMLIAMGVEKRFEPHFAPIRGWYESALTKHRNLLEADIAKHNLGVGSQKIETAEQSTKRRRKIVSLQTAKEQIRKAQETKKWSGRNRIDVCVKYLEKYSIEGKPEYTPQQLNNLVSQQLIKEKNRPLPSR